MSPFCILGAIICGGLGYGLATVIEYSTGWRNGYIAGANEERSLTNSRMIRAKLAAFRDGVARGLDKAASNRPRN